jgi:hypothetical protein
VFAPARPAVEQKSYGQSGEPPDHRDRLHCGFARVPEDQNPTYGDHSAYGDPNISVANPLHDQSFRRQLISASVAQDEINQDRYHPSTAANESANGCSILNLPP